MTICRIDDADNLSNTYKKKVDGPIALGGVLAVLATFFGLIAVAFMAMSGASFGLIWLVFLLVAVILVLGYRKSFLNRNYFYAYVIDDELYCIDIPRACDNSSLFGKMTIAFGGYAAKKRRMNNMKMLPTTSYVDEFVCNRNVAEVCGSIIEKVFDVKEGKEFVKVKVQLTAVNKAGSFFPTRTKTISIPRTFTNMTELRSRLEYLR
ncbi:MAG: phage holin family protein [Ruminococcus sp.]|uniref:phage holin family protein n=1 Tax=Ruminococcus sp. TaxID=41978 RepID=UPI0025CFBAD1|nr:phage holin family protein [Ruminococcus sp.]MCR5599504.1 phage holin family protein [Ruminococcus sp.]